MKSLDQFASEKLAALERAALRRDIHPTARSEGIWAERAGRRLLSFSCNDYIGLTQHPATKAAAIAATERYGTGAGASRLVTGDHPLYGELERRLARLKGTDDAVVFGSGYLANTGILQALGGSDDLILMDELAHSSLWSGARLSRAEVLTFRHNSPRDVETLLARQRGGRRHALVVTESVFSMDGDRAPLAELARICRSHDAWLMADDAHDLDFDPSRTADVPLRVGTLSKTLGSYGGYLCASAPVASLMRSRARTLVYSTGLPPATIAAAIAAIDLIEADPDLLARPLTKALLFTRAAGLSDAESAVVPIVVGDAQAALAASRMLEAEGFLAVAIRPPTVPEGTARLRLAFCAGHPDAEIERLAALVRERILGRAAAQPKYRRA